MKIVRSVAAMQRLARDWQRRGLKIGLVPTMGYLHPGHLSLMNRARRAIGPRGKLVTSIYVNPTQFGPKEDFSRYPRDFRRDAALCRQEGVDIIFAPTNRQMYPSRPGRPFSTFVVEEVLSQGMEGRSRPTHFRGVCTVVAKLFNLVQPDVAVFGAKDYQQATIVQRLVQDLNFPVKILVAPIFRESDGVAMSSRNKYLTGPLRRQAVVLWRGLQRMKQRVRAASKPIPARKLKAELRNFIEREPAARLDYAEFFDPATLAPLTSVRKGAHVALAVFMGGTRLIDNARL
jgi:pantoate--beta-alanine ligase